MVHTAYDSFELLSNCPKKIEAVASHGTKIFLGCSNGSFLIYVPESSDGDRPHNDQSETQKEPYVLKKTLNGFSKRPIVAMEVSRSRELLLSLSESIAFHRIPNLETIAVITKAKGANLFSWDDRRGFLCFARQKRVCIFRHDGGRGFVEVKEYGVPDIVKSMSWCGENICIGIRREYMILNTTSGSLSEVFPSGRIAPPLVVSLPSGELILGKIRSLRAPYTLVQTVVLRNVHHLIQSNGSLIAAQDNSVYALFPVPIGAQIVQLTASGDFEEALALCKLLPPEDSNLRAARESSIHIRKIADFAWDSSYLSRASSDASDDNDLSSPSQLTESDRNAAIDTKKLSYNSVMALVKYLQKRRYTIIERATAEGTEEIVSDAVANNNISYNLNRSKISSKVRGNVHVGSGSREMATILDTALIQALILTGQLSAALELLKGINYCDVKTCEEFLQQGNHYTALIELYKYNGMHREALNLINKLIQESKSDQLQSENSQTFGPEMIIEYLKPICNTDPMLVLEFSMLVLESCPTQTIELFLSGNIPADLVNSYLKQHAPSMQGRYLELMLAMNGNGISGNLQNEMVQIYLTEVLEWYADLVSKQNWDEKAYSPSRKKLLSALQSISGYNPEALLKRLPADVLYEERAILLGKMNHHQLALSLYVHKLHVPELALAYCDRVYEAGQRQPHSELYNNIYLTLLQIYINPQRTSKEFEKNIKNLVSPKNVGLQKVGPMKPKGSRVGKKIAEIEGAEEVRFSLSGTDSGRSDGDGDEPIVEETSSIMIDEVLDLLSRRWDRINGAQALKLLPRETKLQVLSGHEKYNLKTVIVSNYFCNVMKMYAY
ncbi:hypothetical protein Sjap_010367 [Stephania japonica]|uniref:CNH domain-containing protein n=1 Tax=Stephania japonica TaxID=461633 RepID=A0AAP0P6C2_9MAGN